MGVWFFLVACSLPPPLPISDADDDGWSTDAGDCDDHDEAVHPTAVEVCNGHDDDCDGLVDAGTCTAWDPSEEVPSIRGEDGLGPAMARGRFDGDAVDDLLVNATVGNSPAICMASGMRVGGGVDQALADVANCWITIPSQVNSVVVSADRYGVALPVGQDVAIVASGGSLCVVDPFSPAMTLEEGAYGCVATDQFPEEVQSGFRLAAADADRGTLAAAANTFLGIVDPVDYLFGAPPQPAVIEFQARIAAVANAGDLDGDGVTDLTVAVADRAYIVRGDTDLTGPVELITPYFVEGAGNVTALGEVGDLDGDGRREWMTVDAEGTAVWSLTDAVTRLREVSAGATPAGDFDADGRDDLWASFSQDGGQTATLTLFLGGTWPTSLLLSDGDLTTTAGLGGFGASTAPAGDAAADGYADTWVSAPTWATDDQVRGRVYRIDGWALDPARLAPDPVTPTDTGA